jgi:putative ABC transport system ATP-binding protein
MSTQATVTPPEAYTATIVDRVLFLTDGDIVRDLGPSSAHETLETLE